jgi:hypothetical protein
MAEIMAWIWTHKVTGLTIATKLGSFQVSITLADTRAQFIRAIAMAGNMPENQST